MSEIGLPKGKVNIKQLLEEEAESVKKEGFELKKFPKIYGYKTKKTKPKKVKLK